MKASFDRHKGFKTSLSAYKKLKKVNVKAIKSCLQKMNDIFKQEAGEQDSIAKSLRGCFDLKNSFG